MFTLKLKHISKSGEKTTSILNEITTRKKPSISILYGEKKKGQTILQFHDYHVLLLTMMSKQLQSLNNMNTENHSLAIPLVHNKCIIRSVE